MPKKTPLVAIVGRTNVGKSTLFNCLTGKRLAVVKDTPGVTRDRSYAHVSRDGYEYQLIDTGGLVGEDDGPFSDQVREQAELAIAEADVILCVFDGVAGLHPHDYEVVSLLRRSQKDVLWIINKCEKPSTAEQAVEFYGLGIESFLCISSAHNAGLGELKALLKKQLHASTELLKSHPTEEDAIRVAILGRPNVGKSTFVNKLIGEQRLITSPQSGTTRDSVDVTLTRDGHNYELVDTAGLRKKAKIDDGSIERFSNLRTLRSLAQCDVAVLLLEAGEHFPNEQDSKIAGLIHDRGVPFVIVVNKWDTIEKDHKTAKKFKEKIAHELKFCTYAPVLFISALTGKRCPSVLEKAKEVYENSKVRIQTAELNRILERAFTRKPPPVYRGQPIKLFFATQTSERPPTIVLFMSHPNKINFSYQRYIKNSIRKEFPFVGTDIKIFMRKRTEKQDRLQKAAGA